MNDGNPQARTHTGVSVTIDSGYLKLLLDIAHDPDSIPARWLDIVVNHALDNGTISDADLDPETRAYFEPLRRPCKITTRRWVTWEDDDHGAHKVEHEERIIE